MTAPALDFDTALDWAQLLDELPLTARDTEFDIELFDPTSTFSLGRIVDHSDIEIEWRRNKIGAGQLTVPASNEFARLIMACDYTVIPVRITYNGKTWDGRVDASEARGVKDAKEITVDLVSNYVWFHAILAYPAPIPGFEEIQLANVDLGVGPIKSVVLGFVERNVQRLQLRTGQCPITVLPWDRLHDKTEFVELDGRMTYLADLFAEALDRSNCELRIRQYIHGRDPQPAPGRMTLTKSQLIVDVVEHDLVPPALDPIDHGENVIRSISEAVTWALEEATGLILPGISETVQRRLAELTVPSVVWSEESEGIIDATATRKHPAAYSTVVGGKSPDALNKLFQNGIEWALNMALSAAGIIIPGLADVVSGILNDKLFAFMKATDYRLKEQLGPAALPETFTNGGPVAYSLSGRFLADQGLRDARGQRAHKIEVVDGLPWTFGRDYDIGHVVGWEDWGEINYQRCESAKVREDRDQPARAVVEIGETRANEAVGQATLRKLRYALRAVDAITLTPLA